VRTHPVDKLLEKHCYKSAAGLLQLVRFYVCIGVYRAKDKLVIVMKIKEKHMRARNMHGDMTFVCA
jgi:hypothetical protein